PRISPLSLPDALPIFGRIALVTLAPELPGALELIRALVDQGIVVSCGHSDADASTAHAAFDGGARAITHLYNAHRRFAHRDPGLDRKSTRLNSSHVSI